MSVISGTIGAILGSQAQADAARQNAANIAATNAQNYQMFLQSRGSQGNSLLPMYAPAGTEQNLLNQALVAGNLINGNPEQNYAQYQNAVGAVQPAVGGSTQAVNNLFTGNLLNQQLQEAAPVQAAVTAGAQAQRNAINTALQSQLNSINAQEAARGYQGTGSFARNRLLQSTVGAGQTAAQAMANANIQNAAQTQAIQQQNHAMQLQMLSAPFQQAQNNINLMRSPGAALGANAQAAQAPLQFFHLGPQAFQNQNLPYVQPVAGAGQLAAGAMSQVDGQALGVYLKSLFRPSDAANTAAYD